MTEEELYWVGFSVFPGIGPVRFHLLQSYFGSAKRAWHAPARQLQEIHLPVRLVDAFVSFRQTFSLEGYMRELKEKHVIALTLNHPQYPHLLKEIPDAPIVIYVKGKPSYVKTSEGEHIKHINMDKTIAVVGTRHPTEYGITVAKQIVSDLVHAGCTIVSGLAYGIDAVAHETAIACGGKTIAVLGCGVDICAPLANAYIYQKLTEGGYGAVISEMPLGLRPEKGLFVVRNRIISGLSRGVLVVEGEKDSGTLITARNAAEQGRDVFAVPGPITSLKSCGPAALLKNGAILVESAHDILEHV